MSEPSVLHSTYVIERNYPASIERVFNAFADPAKKRRWFAEGEGVQLESFQMDFRVGGTEQTHYRFTGKSPVQGLTGANHTLYQDIQPGRRIVFAYTMTVADRRISASQVTFEFLPEEQGTTLVFTEQAAFFEHSDGPQIREDGWRHHLDGLAAELAADLAGSLTGQQEHA